MAQQKLAADGVISTKEYDYLQNTAVSYGLVSRAAADAAISENKRADQLVGGFEQSLPPMERSLQLMQQIAAFNGTQVQFGVNFQQTGSPYYQGAAGSNKTTYIAPNAGMSGNKGSGTGTKRDNGGSGIAGQMYMIGKGAQPEAFIPNTNGTFVPNADKKMGGVVYNITINNPKGEPAESSIRRSLKMASATGSFQ